MKTPSKALLAPQDLPIYDIADDLADAMSTASRLVLTAPTGSGKSTQVPQILLDRGLLSSGSVVVLQPRRLAARLLASRVAEERGSPLGAEVGYQVRFERQASDATRILYVTEGIVLRRLLSSPNLDGVSTIIFDEFHERHVYGDLTLARARLLQESARPDLKIVVMSATLDTGLVRNYLGDCPVLTSEGRIYPVTIEYAPRPVDPQHHRIWDLAADAFERAVQSGAGGDVLVFMPGAYEITRTIDAIGGMACARGWTLLPLYGELPAAEQDRAVHPTHGPKVVVATNVAETSITIDGVRAVIDSGLARVSRFDPHRGINTLLIEPISQASADQRAGRAGRTAPGRCLRLWTEQDHRGRKPQEIPEIRRIDLAEVLLLLKAHGFHEGSQFPWLEVPEPMALARAEQLLRDLGAADAASGEITDLGRRMVAFPLHPRYARMLIAGHEYGCTREAALIAALTQDRELLIRRVPKPVREARDDLLGERAPSDFLILMRAWRYAQQHRFDLDACRRLGIHARAARQVARLVQQFLHVAEQQGLDLNERGASQEAVQRCVLTAFIDQLAKRRDEGTLRCDLVHGRHGELERDSAVRKSPLFVAAEINEIEHAKQELTVRLRLATAVDEAWLQALFPEAFTERTEVALDASGKRVVANRVRWFRDLVLAVKPGGTPPEEEAAALLAREIIHGRLTLKQWTPAVEQWICRLNNLAAWCPELGLPAIGDDDRLFLLQQICLGSFSAKDIRDQPVWPWLKAWLSAGQEALIDQYAPTHLPLPNGRRGRIRYAADAPPVLSARIQDLYDLNRTPAIAMDRQPLVVEVLGPNQRPLQVTQDLAGFWQTTYPELKKTLKKRYPKHEWR
ncbi:ATP-dependent helicase HrpB [Candidatus Entotheonella palauensis]|uniref:ATP-dependent helicase HrpB n=1 Tax=Candidatus Entotheonella palauensis TaxID=93172 RepID=UPI000B7F7694|nr:ATP-dependent helicase HrpB [Candidatus Entotheonella palauensis]